MLPSLSTKRSNRSYRKACQGYSELKGLELCKSCQYLRSALLGGRRCHSRWVAALQGTRLLPVSLCWEKQTPVSCGGLAGALTAGSCC